MVMEILMPALVLGALGLLFGAGLAVASKKFAVEVNPAAEQIRESLPGANCGGCGFAGCDAYAAAVAEGRAPVNGCPVGGAKVAQVISQVMGVEVEETERMVARVACQGTFDKAKKKYLYEGLADCNAAALVSGGDKACKYGCLGLGSCVKACPFDAIHIGEGGIAQVDEEKCVACGNCVAACPKDIIQLIPASKLTMVACRAIEKGRAVRENCVIGCIACGKCEKNCKFDAIHIENNLPVIDYAKCTSCMVCREVCPTHAISANIEKRRQARIDADKCIGCTICKRNCAFGAIEGEVKQKHVVIPSECKGCGVCVSKCPKKAIELV